MRTTAALLRYSGSPSALALDRPRALLADPGYSDAYTDLGGDAMSVEQAFDDFQKTVNADKDHVDLARERRDVFKKAFTAEPDVAEVFGSGSLARSTQLDPVHDVDVVIVYQATDHPDWGQPGDSAGNALEHTRGRVKDLLGATDGSVEKLVRYTRWRNHAVKCWVDPPEMPDAFTVDAMPAMRQTDGTLLIPQAATGNGSRSTRST
jgi:hypothetical protein